MGCCSSKKPEEETAAEEPQTPAEREQKPASQTGEEPMPSQTESQKGEESYSKILQAPTGSSIGSKTALRPGRQQDHKWVQHLILVLALQCLVQKVVLPYLLSNKIKSQ
jgi:hypothetical protein